MRVRRVGLVAAVVLGLATLTGCNEKDRMISVQPVGHVHGEPIDFGEVPVGDTREAVIEIANPGRVPFALRSLQLANNPSFKVIREDDVVPPGSTRRVVVRFQPLAEGELADQVNIDTDGAALERVLDLRGTGVPAPIVIEPPLLDYETVELDSERVLELTVTNPVDLPVELVMTGEAAAHFQPLVASVPPNATLKIPLRYLPSALGAHSAQLEARVCAGCTPKTAETTGDAVPHAFSFSPAPVPFEPVPVHSETQSFVELTNITWRAVTLGDLLTSDPAFAALNGLRGMVLEPGQSARVDLEFAARSRGPSVGALEVLYQSDRERRAQVTLDARGGRPQLALTPVTIDFGEVPIGGKVERMVRLSNAGANGALHFTGVAGTGQIDQFSVSNPRRAQAEESWTAGSAWPELTADRLPIQPGGDYLDVRVFFEPVTEGEFAATLTFRSDDLFQPEQTIQVTGRSRPSGPCRWRVLPASGVDFGNVPAGSGAVLGFRFENAGSRECAVKDIHLADDGGGAFYMPGGPLTGGVIREDDGFSAMLAFRSATPGSFEGTLQLTVNDPSHPTITLPLRAIAQESCLAADPNFVDFGPVRYDCDPEPKLTRVRNRCSTPIEVTDVEIGEGTSRQYRISRAPSLPLTLQPGESFELEARYSRTVHGQHYSPLFFHASGEPGPFLIPLLAETNHDGTTVERFTQATADRLDVLFVVSNTSTMAPWQQRLADAVPGWFATAEALRLNLQAGVTSTGLVARNNNGTLTCGGGAGGGESGRLLPIDNSRPRIVRGAVSQASTLQANLQAGICHNLVQGLEAARAALSPPLVDSADDPRTSEPADGNAGLLRSSARLAVIFLADEDDNSGFDADGYVQFLRELKGQAMSHRVQAHAIKEALTWWTRHAARSHSTSSPEEPTAADPQD